MNGFGLVTVSIATALVLLLFSLVMSLGEFARPSAGSAIRTPRKWLSWGVHLKPSTAFRSPAWLSVLSSRGSNIGSSSEREEVGEVNGADLRPSAT